MVLEFKELEWPDIELPIKPNHQGTYEVIGASVGRTVDEKQSAYGNSFGQSEKFLNLLWPDGIPVSAYSDVLVIIRMWDKMKRIATDKDAFGESPYKDIAGYGLLGYMKDRQEKKEWRE